MLNVAYKLSTAVGRNKAATGGRFRHATPWNAGNAPQAALIPAYDWFGRAAVGRNKAATGGRFRHATPWNAGNAPQAALIPAYDWFGRAVSEFRGFSR